MEILMTILPFVPVVIIAIALIALLASGYSEGSVEAGS